MTAVAAPAFEQIDEYALRVTMPLPLGIDHVHCYVIRGESGGLILVDTGLGLAGAEAFWSAVRDELEEPVTAVFVTHCHPDHVGGAALVAALWDAPLYQGELDWEICRRAGEAGAPERLAAWVLRHGTPAEIVEQTQREHVGLWHDVQWQHERRTLVPGDVLDGWRVLHLPGHSDGHLALLRDGVLVSGDVLLDPITPHVALGPVNRTPDPLGDYLETLRTVETLDAELALPGHHAPIRDPAARAAELQAHHARRLAATLDAVAPRPVTAYDASLTLFGRSLAPTLRRFALLETLSHLEHLALRGELQRTELDGHPAYASKDPV